MSKFDELKKRAEHAKEEFLFMGLKPEEVLEVLAIQAQLVAALEMMPFILETAGNEHERAIVAAALAAAGAQP